MHVTQRLIVLSAVCGLGLAAGTARAQEEEIDVDVEVDEVDPPPAAGVPYDRDEHGVVVIRQTAPPEVELEDEEDVYADSIVFLEATGGGGVQLGDTEYLPSGTPGDWQFPLVYGFGVGGSAGVMIADHVALVASYTYQRAQTRDGQLEGAITNVEGRIDYHTALAGVRLYAPTGFGAFRAELAAGVVFPHSTELQVDYGPALSALPQPITGSGFRTSDYSVGFGGQGKIGYEVPIVGPLYAAMDIQIQVFQAENSGETTELRNFVTDFAATPPTAVSATIEHGDGAMRPETRGVASGLALFSLGARL